MQNQKQILNQCLKRWEPSVMNSNTEDKMVDLTSNQIDCPMSDTNTVS